MPRLYLTDEDADLDGYKRLKLGSRSDNSSLIRAVTTTVAGPTSGIQATRTAGGTALKWITDPLDGTDLVVAAGSIEYHVWAYESAAAVNAALRFQLCRFTTAELAAYLDHNPGTELGTSAADYAATVAQAALTMSLGDRLALKILVDDATAVSLAAGTVTIPYNGYRARAEGDSYITVPDAIGLAAGVPGETRMRIRRYLMDTSATNPNLNDAALDQALDAALREYSSDRPRRVVGAINGDGSAYSFGLPSNWVDGFSVVQSVEYPAGEQKRRYLESQDWEITEGVLGSQPIRSLYFPQYVPESGTSNILVAYTARHVHTDETDTVRSDDLDAVCMLAAAYGCEMLAARAAGNEEPTIGADVASRQSETDRYVKMAKEYRTRYTEHMGQGKDEAVGAASVIIDWDANLSSGMDRIFHPRRGR